MAKSLTFPSRNRKRRLPPPQLQEQSIFTRVMNAPVIKQLITGFDRIGNFPTMLTSPLTREEEIADALKYRGMGADAVLGRTGAALSRIPGNLPTALKSMIPLGETMGIYERPEGFVDPYETGKSFAASMAGRAGLDPEGGITKWGSRGAGMGLSVAADPLSYIGGGVRTGAKAVTMLGQFFDKMGAPARAMRRVTSAAEKGIGSSGRLASTLTKPVKFADMVSAPFRGIGRGVESLAEGEGAIGGLARGAQRLGTSTRRALSFKGEGGILQRSTQRALAGSQFAADSANASVNYMAKGGTFGRRAAMRALKDLSIAPNASGYLKKVIAKLGDSAMAKSIDEIASVFGENWPQKLQELRDAKKLSQAIRALPVSQDTQRLIKGLAGEMKLVEELRFAQLQKYDPDLLKMESSRISYSPRIIDPVVRNAMYKEKVWNKFTQRGLDYLRDKLPADEFVKLEDEMAGFARQEMPGDVNRVKSAIEESIGKINEGKVKAGHIAEYWIDKAREIDGQINELKQMRSMPGADKGIIRDALNDLLKGRKLTLRNKKDAIAKFLKSGGKLDDATGKLQYVDDVINEGYGLKYVGEPKTMRAGLGEFHRMPLSRYLTTAEMNKLAREAGLTDDAVLALEHPGIAFGKKELSQRKRLVWENTKQAVAEAADIQAGGKAGLVDDAKLLDTEFIPVQGRRDLLQAKTGSRLEGQYALHTEDGWRLINDEYGSALKNVAEITVSPKQLGDFAKVISGAWQKVMSFTKGVTLNYSLAYHVRNMIDDSVRMVMSAGPAVVADGYTIRSRMLANTGYEMLQQFGDGVRRVNLDDIREALVKEGKIGGFFHAESPYAVGSFQAGKRNILGKVAEKSQQLGEFAEDFRSEAMTIGLLNKYRNMPFDEALGKAASEAADTLYRYSEKTAFQRNVSSKVILFDTFLQKNMAWQVGQLLKDPFRSSMALRAPSMLFGEDLTADEREVLPDWIKQRSPFVVERKGDDIVVNAGMGLSINDLNKLWPSEWYREGVGSLAPQIRVPLELISGRYIFLDMPIKDRRRIYTPDTQALFSKLFPGQDDIKFGDFATRMKVNTRSGEQKEYWVVPSWVMYAISNLRPANDLRKLLDPRQEGKAWWLVTGQKDYPFDVERMRERKLQEQIQESLRELEPFGVIGEVPIIYKRKGISGPADVTDKATEELLKLKAYQQQRRPAKMKRPRPLKLR